MANAGDIIQEFKQAKPPEKAVIIGAIVAVVAIAVYWRTKVVGGQQSSPVGNGGPTASTGGANSAFPSISTSGGPVPYLPSNTNPVFSPGGTLVGYQQTDTASNTKANTQQTSDTSTSSNTKTNTNTDTQVNTSPGPLATFVTANGPVTRVGAWGYDPAHTKQGAPIRDVPGGNVIGHLSYGAGQQVQVAGEPISGPNNFGPNVSAGSTKWYQLTQGGYVSAFDVSTPNRQTLQAGSAPGSASLLRHRQQTLLTKAYATSYRRKTI